MGTYENSRSFLRSCVVCIRGPMYYLLSINGFVGFGCQFGCGQAGGYQSLHTSVSAESACCKSKPQARRLMCSFLGRAKVKTSLDKFRRTHGSMVETCLVQSSLLFPTRLLHTKVSTNPTVHKIRLDTPHLSHLFVPSLSLYTTSLCIMATIKCLHQYYKTFFGIQGAKY